MATKITDGVAEDLWTVEQLAAYLQRSRRWVYGRLKIAPSRSGSIPHVRLPAGAPRFIPSVIRAWVRASCPPADRFHASPSEH